MINAEADIPTFREAAEAVHKIKRPTWSSAKHAANWMGRLEKYAMPTLGTMRVDRIQRIDVLNILKDKDLWTEKPETARRVRQPIRETLSWCQAHEYVEHNVAGEMIDGALPPMPRIKKHLRSMNYLEVPDALKTVDGCDASLASKLCLRFTILTAARPGEARGNPMVRNRPGRAASGASRPNA